MVILNKIIVRLARLMPFLNTKTGVYNIYYMYLMCNVSIKCIETKIKIVKKSFQSNLVFLNLAA